MSCRSRFFPDFSLTRSLNMALASGLMLSGITPFSSSGQETSAASSLTDTDALVARLVEESQKHKVARKSDPKDPVWQAESYASGLADEVSLYNEWMLKVILKYAERGDLAEAAYVSDQLPGAGSALAHAELAVIHARKTEKSEAERHIQAAKDASSSVSRLFLSKVLARCALALKLLKLDTEAVSLLSQVEELELLDLDTALQQEGLAQHLTLAQAQARLDQMTARGSDEAKCHFLLACAEQHLKSGKSELGLPFLEAVSNLSSKNGLPTAQHVLIDVARLHWMSGQTQEAKKTLSFFLQCCERYADAAEWKAPFISDAVSLLLDWKQPDEARVWLKLAETSLPKVYVLDSPQAVLAVGRQLARLDGAEVRDRFAVMAAQAGLQHPHPRSRASAAVQIALYYAELGASIPASVTKILSAEPGEGAE